MVRIAMLRAVVAAGAATAAAAQFTTPDPGCEVLDFVQEGWGAARNNVDGACSGHGTCANATCTCDEGWTGRADFLDTEGEDCAVFEPAVRAVWGINTFFILAYFGIGLPRVLLRWRQHQDAIHQKRAQGSSYSLRNNRGMMACLYMYSITFPALLSYGLLMQLDPSQRVGLDLNVTIAYAIARTGFYGSVWLFQPALLSTILRGSRATRHLVKVNDTFSFFLCLFAVGLGYMPFVTLAMSDGRDELALTVYYISTGGTWLFVFLLGIQAIYVKVKVTEVLEKSYQLSKHERTLRIKDALVAVQKENLFQATLQVSLYSLFLLWPFMYNKHCYMLPLSWIAYGILAKKLAFTTVSYESGSRTNMSTLQSKDNSKDYSRDVRSLDESAVQSSQAATFTFKKAPLAPYSGPVRTPPPPPISTYKSYDSIQESDDDLV